jgi:hypothetical protein
LAGDSNRPRGGSIVTKNLRTQEALGLGHTVGYGWDEMKSVTGADAEALATTIDFARARKQIEALELPPTVKARALWVFMGLSEMAAVDGSVGLLATDFIPRLELNRASWTALILLCQCGEVFEENWVEVSGQISFEAAHDFAV